jgi:hypothetical protein
VLLSAAALPLAGCFSKRFAWNQKVTVVVDTPLGEKSGAAVTSVFVHSGTFFASASGVDYKLAGEATVVEVSPGKYLFALIGESSKDLAARAWPYYGLQPDESWAKIEAKRESIELTAKLYPMLVTFDDINDPKTVKLVDPADLAATFGLGYALKSIALEITDDAATVGVVDKVTPWTAVQKGRLKEIPVPTPKGYIPRPEEEIYRGNFTQRKR